MKIAALAILGMLIFASTSSAQTGSALSFDGSDDRVTVPYDSSFPTDVFTITAWIKTLPSMGRAAIIARGEDDNSFNLSWQAYVQPDGTLRVMLEDQSDTNFCYPFSCMGQPQPTCTFGNLFVADDLWHHIAITRDAIGNLVLYVDGQAESTCTQTGVPSSNNFQSLTIGCTHGTIGPPPGGVEPPIWFFPGLIDEPAMWNVALTAGEVSTVFESGVDPDGAGLVGYWDFDAGSGQQVLDLSVAANHGFLGADGDVAGDPADPQWVSLAVEFRRADCNADGQTDIADAISVLNYLFGAGGEPPCRDACDINDDGTLDISDAISSLADLFDPTFPPVPPPHPGCGADPTSDGLNCSTFPPCP
ncbi:MAG TPA: hypothetical protein EYN40_06715 [Planctomycetes bacterium]|nr:hypothetical protein [Planctomycetota bacterium]HIO66366.1 hypothetical protein [Planctomycetota bacterium]